MMIHASKRRGDCNISLVGRAEGGFVNMASVCEVKSEVSQCLFEFLHMQIVSYFEESCGKEKSVR